jgi:murein DD-endopeptidase MepM/ murein hydrolase activator NlpD
MSNASLLLWGLAAAQLSAGQGEALRMSYADEPALGAVEVRWNGTPVPFARQGEQWFTLIGVDLDAAPGEHTAEVRFTYRDGRERVEREKIRVESRQFPTTRLTVEPRYVEPDPEDQARAARESREIAEIYARVTPEAYWSEPFQVPIPGASDGRNFGHRRVFNNQPRAPHSGSDLRAATGTPIHAANRGRVTLARELFFSGNAVFLDHGLGVHSVYLHLSEILVEPGEMVERGQRIGLAGATGRVTGPHLHWGVRIVDARVDPFSLLAVDAEGGGAVSGGAR